jgi:SP family arabinose:H+ symporter-like MFS transporter
MVYYLHLREQYFHAMAKVTQWSMIVSLGGLLFGFDTAVISGAEQAIQKQWNLSDAMVGQMVAMALYGTVIGALFAGKPADMFGRKKSLIFIAFLYLISALGSALAPEVISLMFFRFIGGIGVGASSVVAPMYISEISPPEQRGRLTALFQFNLVAGILLAYLSNYFIGSVGDEQWRVMLGVEVLPALLFCALIFTVPRSPRWLMLVKGDEGAALEVLKKINPGNAMKALEEIKKSIGGESVGLKAFFSGKFARPILLAFLLALFNQISGINAVIYYAPRIFEMAGMQNETALLSSAGIGLVNLLFTMLGLALIDRMGRRFLMYVGSLGYIVSLCLVAFAFSGSTAPGFEVAAWLFMFIASHAIGQGAVIWVFIAEIFPNKVRGWGQSLGCGTHWIMAAIIAGGFPWLASKVGPAPIFGIFAVCMVFQLLFVWKMMPETKGKSLENLEAQLALPMDK